ncbi:efflux RND transporter periplasmic adaptor subunit [Herbaspirillum camelliae]|uniref:efflux RND transporter periplasmic adaptor subunit n=1 Tax=Herbaspirillum camelliae TaxID=1892903 RepID=UPI000949DC6A|nr:efflux RND transporter periplasmic adaptor subunit [Herbaspirillum camelliae]
MNKRTVYLASTLFAAIFAASLVSNQSGRAHAQSTDPQSKQSAQVVVKPVQLKSMGGTLVTYGDVAAGTVRSVSSASAASITTLNVMQGAAVKRGQIIAVLGGDPMTRLAYEQAQTSVEQTKEDLARLLELQTSKLATQTQVDVARKAKADAEANLVAQRELGGDRAGQIIKAPVDGVVLSLSAAQGDRLQPGVPFMQIGSTETLKVLLGVDPADLRSVRPGLTVRLAELSGAGPMVEAKVADVYSVVDPKTQLANVLVKIPATAHLTPGSRVRADIVLPGQDAYEVPRQAVLTDADGSYLFQVVSNVAHRVAVKKIVDNGKIVGVTGAIDGAKPVVVLGNYELTEGMAVRVAQ